MTPKLFISDLKDFFCIYAKEIHEIFQKSTYRTTKINEADYIITCLSDELNYPKYGNMPYARSNLDIKNIKGFVDCFFPQHQKKVVFCHIPVSKTNSIITVCYSKDDTDQDSIVICPPAIIQYSFNQTLNRKYLMSFKGNIKGSINRYNIFKKLQNHSSERVVLIDRTDHRYDYDDLMKNSLFSVIIEGDLPWSYRLTEAINAGCIPIIIKPKNKNIFG